MKILLSSMALLCLSVSHPSQSTPEPLIWAGCGITKKAFMAELASTYEKKFGTKIILEGGGATKGIRRTADKTVHLGGACRSRIEGHAEEYGVSFNPVAWDALVAITHKDNPIKNITLAQLKGIYEGNITRWKELGGPDEPIEVMTRGSKNSGVGRTFRHLVFNDHEKQFPSSYVFPSSAPLEIAVATNPNAIGVTGISSAKRRDVSVMTLEGKSSDFENIKNGEYLLYRPLYLTYSVTHPRYKEIKKFITFAHSRTGRDIIKRMGVVPYLDAIHLVRRQREQWDNLRQ